MMVNKILTKHDADNDAELRRALEILATFIPPDLLDVTCATLAAWRRMTVLRERQRLYEVLAAAVDLDLIVESLDWLAKTDLPAEMIIHALRQRAASEPCGVPS